MITVQDLINKSAKTRGKEEVRIDTLELKEFENTVKVEIPTPSIMGEYANRRGADGELISDEELTKILVYDFMIEPKLSDERLIQATNCKGNPYSVVEKVFSSETLVQLGNYIMNEANKRLADYSVKKVVDIKN